MQTDTIAIDFGTSNSAAAVPYGDGIFRIPIEQGSDTLPTAVFFPTRGDGFRIGASAADALIAGAEGRYMRALKSVLGLPLLHEKRLIGGRRRTISEIITEFLLEMRLRAEQGTGLRFRRVLSGRPVRFHSADLSRDAQAEADLRQCYLAAGYDEVAFLAESEAAAMANHALGDTEQLGLIVDIGGGTSDFSVFRGQGATPEILANHGIRLGGTDFDHAVSMDRAMPLLGLGGQLRREMGEGFVPMPRAPFVDLATWAKIPFLYTPETRRLIASMIRLAPERQKLQRFSDVLDLELGHELAFAVERGKIAANGAGARGRIDMGFIEKGLSAPVCVEDLDRALTDSRSLLGQAAAETIAMASLRPEQIGRVVMVGGSSLMGFVTAEMRALCPNAQILRSEAFTGVVDGLAIASRQRHRFD